MLHEIAGPTWIPRFLETLTATKRVNRATKAAGVTPSAIYFQRKTNRQFADAWQAAAAGTLAQIAPAMAPPRTPAESSMPVAARSNAGWRAGFLEALAETSNITASARRANVPIETVYKTRRKDAEFANKWRAALLEGYDLLEMEVLGHLRDPSPARKMDVAAAIRLLAAHRQTVERERALREDDDEEAVLESIDRFIDDMIERRAANAAVLTETEAETGTEKGAETGAGDGVE